MKKEKTNLKILSKMHINYKDWQKVSKLAILVGIKTFAELEMYCRVWKVKTALRLFAILCKDCVEATKEKNYEIMAY